MKQAIVFAGIVCQLGAAAALAADAQQSQPAPAAPIAASAPEKVDVEKFDINEPPTDPYSTQAELDSADAAPAMPGAAGPLFPNAYIVDQASHAAWKRSLRERTGLEFAFQYNQLNQWGSKQLPNGISDASFGIWTGVNVLWTLIDKGGANPGRLNFSFAYRGGNDSTCIPALYGLSCMGMNWATFEFTSWDGVAIENLFWDQTLLDGKLNIRVGNYTPIAMFNFGRFKDSRVSFTASPFAFMETIPYPTFGLGAYFRWQPIDDSPFYMVGLVNDLNGDPNEQGLNWSTFGRGEYFYGTEFGYNWRRPNGEFDHLHVNLFWADERSTRNPTTFPNVAGGGFRIYAEKQIGNVVGLAGYTYNTAEGGGISASFNRNTLTAGVAVLNPWQVRGEAAIGAAWSQPFLDILPGSGQRSQYGIEAYWRIQVAPNVTMTPGMQFVFNPALNPTVDFIYIPSFKFRVVF